MTEDDLQGQLTELRHREKYLTGLVCTVKLALGDEQMPDDEVEAAVLATVRTKTRVQEIAAFLKQMVLPMWAIVSMRQNTLQRELKEKYPEWETEV